MQQQQKRTVVFSNEKVTISQEKGATGSISHAGINRIFRNTMITDLRLNNLKVF